MVLVGLGLVTVSFAFLLYRYPPRSWKHGLGFGALLWRGEISPVAVQDTQHQQKQDLLTTPPPEASEQNDSKHAEPASDEHLEDLQSTTPKASAQPFHNNTVIPQFSLDTTDHDGGNESHVREVDIRSRSEDLKAQDGGAKPAPSTTAPTLLAKSDRPSTTKPSTTLMPPPSVKPSALRPLPKLNGSLNPPPSSAAVLRGPPSLRSGGMNTNLAASTSTLPPSSRPSRKVVLEPGYSPLDWAHLVSKPPTPSFLRGNSVPGHLIKVKPSQLKEHHGRKGQDAWGTFQGKVYNLTPYLKFHPGGVGELMRGAGKLGDAERLFMEVHHWINWDGILGECLVGILVGESEGTDDRGNGLDDMD